MLCILPHRGVQLILAYSWARPAVLAAGKGRGAMFFYFFCPLLSFIFLSPLSLSFLSTISSISILPFSGRRHKMTPRVDMSLNNYLENHNFVEVNIEKISV